MLLRQIFVPVLLNVGPLFRVPLLFGPAEGFGRLTGLEWELGPLEIQEVGILVGELAVEFLGGWKEGTKSMICQCN